MSINAVAWGMKQKVGDGTAKLILLAICDRYNEEYDYAWPSVDWLAQVGDCSRRTASRKLSKLQDMGFISVQTRYKQTSQYRLNFSGVTPLTCQSSVMSDSCLTNNNINDTYKNKRTAKKKVSEWTPTDADRSYAKDKGLDADDILESIRLWDKQNGNKAAYSDLTAFWQGWCRREAKRRPAPLKRDYGANKSGDWIPGQKHMITPDEWAGLSDAMRKHYRNHRPDAIIELKKQGVDTG